MIAQCSGKLLENGDVTIYINNSNINNFCSIVLKMTLNFEIQMGTASTCVTP